MLQEYRISDEGKIIEYDKVQVAIDRLREFEPPEGYYLAFSGGKDSVVIYDLAVRSGVKFDAHYNLTTVDPPELVQFIKRQYPEVEIHKPEKTMWQLIPVMAWPPTRLVRYCCRYLKESGGASRVVVTGVRWAESQKRKQRRMMEACHLDSSRTFLHPVIDWSNEDVWGYIHHYNIIYCSLYDEGFLRLGCIMCPMGDKNQMIRHSQRWPKVFDAYKRAFDKMLKVRAGKGLPTQWETADDVINWWIYSPAKGDPDQGVLFE